MSPRVLSPGKVVEVFYDAECPLCMREIRMLMRRDRDERIQFTDITAPKFDPSVYGTTYDALMTRIRGRLADGTWIEGVEVFRRLYTAVGFRWLVAVTRLPVISHVLSIAYAVFAKNRLRLTGRCARGECALAPSDATASSAGTS